MSEESVRSLAQREFDRARAEYLAEREHLLRVEQSSIQDYDKSILSLSTTFIGISVTLASFFGKSLQSPVLLHVAWYSLTIAVSMTLFSLYFSSRAFRRQCQILHTEFDRRNGEIARLFRLNSEEFGRNVNDEHQPVAKNLPAVITSITTALGGISFAVGILFIALFGAHNL